MNESKAKKEAYTYCLDLERLVPLPCVELIFVDEFGVERTDANFRVAALEWLFEGVSSLWDTEDGWAGTGVIDNGLLLIVPETLWPASDEDGLG